MIIAKPYSRCDFVMTQVSMSIKLYTKNILIINLVTRGNANK